MYSKTFPYLLEIEITKWKTLHNNEDIEVSDLSFRVPNSKNTILESKNRRRNSAISEF